MVSRMSHSVICNQLINNASSRSSNEENKKSMTNNTTKQEKNCSELPKYEPPLNNISKWT